MSFALFWASFFSPFMSTWMGKLECHKFLISHTHAIVLIHMTTSHSSSVPKESGAFLAAGTTASCTWQGFLESFFYALAIIMNAVLAVTYCNIVRRLRQDKARSKRSLWLVSVVGVLC